MDYIEIKKNSNVVKTLVAQAKHESVDSDVAKRTNEMIAELAKEPNPHNRYQIAQLIGFAVNEIVRPKTNWLDQIADTKRVGYGEKAQFKVRLEGIRAYVGAKGGTPARSKVANKTITLDTVAVSARPSVNLVEMQNGQADMAALINDAAYQMELAYYQYIQGTAADTNAQARSKLAGQTSDLPCRMPSMDRAFSAMEEIQSNKDIASMQGGDFP